MPESERFPDRNALQAVLEEALQAPESSRQGPPVDMQALTEVARRHQGGTFALDPIAIEMVQALLESYFKGWDSMASRWRGMSAEIAKTLFEDPVCHERMERIWNKLAEKP